MGTRWRVQRMNTLLALYALYFHSRHFGEICPSLWLPSVSQSLPLFLCSGSYSHFHISPFGRANLVDLHCSMVCPSKLFASMPMCVRFSRIIKKNTNIKFDINVRAACIGAKRLMRLPSESLTMPV